MRFRLPDWDVEMPSPLVSYWTAWNETDLAHLPRHLASAVTEDVEWNDPRDSFIGIDELEAAIRKLRTTKPGYRFVMASTVARSPGYNWLAPITSYERITPISKTARERHVVLGVQQQ